MSIKTPIDKLFNLFSFVLWFSFWCAVSTGCDTKGEAASSSENGAQESQVSEVEPTEEIAPTGTDKTDAKTVVSDELPEKPERIVSLAPNITEIVFELDAGERVVGVTRFCDYPPDTEDVPKIGGVIDPDLEAIAARKPDLVIGVTSGADTEIQQQLDAAGLAYAFVEMDDIEETYAGIRVVGDWIGASSRADELADSMRARIDELTVESPADRPSVLFVYGRKPLTVAGPGTFGHELIRRAGGRNPMAGAENKYPKIDLEKVLEIDPDRIIEATMAPTSDADYWAQYDELAAVKHEHVYRLEDNALLRPGPRLVEALESVRAAIQGPSDEGTDAR